MSRGAKIDKKKQVAEELERKRTLRNRAEDVLREKHKGKITRTPEEVESLIHELEVHQIELEMQNEELRHAQMALLESCDHYADLYDNAPVGYITINDKGLVLGANITVADLLHTERRKLANKRFSRFIFDDDQDIYYKYRQNLLENNERISCELRMMKTGGRQFWAKLDSVPMNIDGENPVHFRIAITDITKLKQVEENLRTTDKRFNNVLKLMKSGVGIYKAIDDGEDFIIIHSYQAELSRLIETSKELTGKRLLDVFPEIKEHGLLDVLKRVWHTGKPENHTVTMSDGEDNIGWRENYIYRLPTGEIVSIYEDITDRMKMDIALRDSEYLFRSIFETSPNPININRLKDGKFIAVNHSFLKLMGYAESEVIGKTGFDINAWHDLANRKLFFDILLKDGKVENFGAKFRRKDGSLLTAQVSSALIMYKNEEHLLAITRDITDLKNAEKALQKSHEQLKKMYAIRTGELEDSEVKYSTLVEALLTGVHMTDKEEIVFNNVQFEKIFGYEKHELQNTSILELIHPQDKEKFKEMSLAQDNEGEEFEIRGVKKNGDTIYLQGRNSTLDFKGRKIILGNISDITKRKLAEKELLHAKINYRIVADYTYDWEWWSDHDGTFRYVSPACERITGYKAEQFLENGSLLRKIIVPEDRDMWDEHDHESHKDVGLREMQFRIKRPNGDIRWIEHACQPVYTKENEYLGFRASNRDTTERKLVERTLNENRRRLIKAEQIARMGFMDWNLTTNEIVMSRELCDLYGIDPGMITSVEQIVEMVHPDDIQFVQENLNSAMQGLREYNIDHRMVRPDGKVIWVHARADLERDKDGRPGFLIGTVIDITERKRAEKERDKADAELRLLSTQLLSAEERERKRIANEIHDSIGQALSAIKFSIENSLLSIETGALSSTRTSLEKIVPLTQQTIEEVRRIIMDLRPSILDDLGLKATISWFCREFETVYSDIDVETAIHVEESDIPVQMKTVIYRILQEAFNNAAKHSRTEHIRFKLTKSRGHLELLVEDEGCGFIVEEVLARTSDKRGMGLASMHERALLSGGDISFLSKPGVGTKIQVSWPMKAMFLNTDDISVSPGKSNKTAQ